MIVTEKNENSLFSVFDPFAVKLLTRLKLKVSHLNGYKFRHGLDDTVSAICRCNAEIRDTEHFLLRCHFCSVQRFELFNNIKTPFDPSFTQLDTNKKSIFCCTVIHPTNLMP